MRINIWYLLIVFVGLYFIFQIRGDIIQHKELSSDKTALAARIKEFSEENGKLTASIANAKSGKNIERLARERLNFIKKGETAFKICQ